MNTTAIGWTDFSANPLKYRRTDGSVVWACAKVSQGCTHCYSEALALRWNKGAAYNAGEVAKLTPFMDEKELRAMRTSKKISGKRVFVGDMTDLFGEWVPWSLLDELFDTFAQRPDVIFQVLTKRAERMRTFLSDGQFCPRRWPLPNVWIGVSCEEQQRASERISLLLQTPAAIRFISAEPLLDEIALPSGLDWVIVGGESGPRFRDCGIGPILGIARQCQRDNVPVFVKQDAHRLPGQQGRIPDEFWLKQFPLAAGRGKGRP